MMSNNISSQEQVKKLINEMNNISTIKLLVSTDQEGGVVARVPWDEARHISQPHIGIVNREDFAYETGTQHADALKEAYINMNLAPVLDVSSDSASAMINRTFAADPSLVANLGTSMIFF